MRNLHVLLAADKLHLSRRRYFVRAFKTTG